MCDLENQVVFQTLISNHLEIVELPINKEDLNLMRSLIEQISSLNNLEKLNCILDNFPKYHEASNFLNGALLTDFLYFENLDCEYKTLGKWRTKNYQIENSGIRSLTIIPNPKIKIEILTQGETLTYLTPKPLDEKSLIYLDTILLPPGQQIIKNLKSKEEYLELMFDHLHLTYQQINISLFE